jgi:hypothetical protein
MKTRLAVLVVFVLVVTPAIAAQARHPNGPSMKTHLVPNPDVPSREVDPNHKLLFGNAQARAFRVELAAHATSGSIQHGHDYFIVAVEDSKFTIVNSGLQLPFEMRRGELQILKGGWPHRVANDSAGGIRLVEVELTRRIDPEHAMCGIGGHLCSDSSFGRDSRGNYLRTKLMETASVRVHKVQLDPGVELPQFTTSGESILVALTDLDDGEVHLRAGEAGWQSRGAHLLNTGTAPAEFLLLEMK